jgi:hypothetical protein
LVRGLFGHSSGSVREFFGSSSGNPLVIPLKSRRIPEELSEENGINIERISMKDPERKITGSNWRNYHKAFIHCIISAQIPNAVLHYWLDYMINIFPAFD